MHLDNQDILPGFLRRKKHIHEAWMEFRLMHRAAKRPEWAETIETKYSQGRHISGNVIT